MQVLEMITLRGLRRREFRTYDAEVATFGERLRELRGELSQEKLGERMGHKRPSAVQGWERGKVPKPDTIRKIAKALGVEPSAFFEGVITAGDRLRGSAMVKLIAYASLLPAEDQAVLAETAQSIAADAGKQWRDVPAAGRKHGTPAKAHTSRR